MIKQLLILTLLLAFISCYQNSSKTRRSYAEDIKQLNINSSCIELKANSYFGKVCICPEYQGRVMTSTGNIDKDISNGWINRSKLGSNYKSNGSNLGGEDRLWIGPLGGQFSFFYGQQKPLSEDNWQVPASMNEEAYKVISQTSKSIAMEKHMRLTNFIGTTLNMLVQRNISVLEKNEIETHLKLNLPQVDMVAYESKNILTNKDSAKWDKNKGLATIWSLSMFEGTDKGVVIIPLKKQAQLKDINTYLGALDKQRIKVKDNCLFFKSDGKYRSKLGIPNHLALPIFGNYKPETNTLTIIQYRKKEDSMYFNSKVSMQDNPYNGEPIQIYNHGSMDYSPVEEASFFELESTAAFKELAPDESLIHYHRVFHFTGNVEKLNSISVQLLGIDISRLSFKNH